MIIQRHVILTLALSICIAVRARGADTPAGAGPAVDFTRDVQPILADNCYFCHGPDSGKRKADLRLDVLDPKIGPFAPRDGYAILTPGKLDDSVLIMRITSDDPDVHMPPTKANRHLTDKQVETIKRWVEQGAKWSKHWSLIPPTKPKLPEVADQKWCRNDIDRFILARLEKENLKPSPDANKETLIRRVTLDLTGLPPTPAEVDAFLADQSSDAYEKVVDRLLASPRFGERMTWDWLDLARYADTNGYQNDPTRTQWPWRDWVITAFNENLPYNDFITWQLAGDLLPNATQEQRLASGFNRNHPYNGEGGRIPEETRVENVMDRADTAGVAFIGLTVGCAKCHDHKYDPITQKDYYRLYAFFNQCSEDGRGKYVGLGNVPPVMMYDTPEKQEKSKLLAAAAKEAADKLAAAMPKLDADQQVWESSERYAKGWIVATPASATSTNGVTLKTQSDSSILASGASPDTDVQEIVVKSDLDRITAVRIEALPDPSLPLGGPGRSPESANFVLTNLEATAFSATDQRQSKKLKFASADATYFQQGFDVAGAIDTDAKTGWAVMGAPEKDKISAVFRFEKPADNPGGGIELHLKLHFESQYKQHTLGRFRIALTDGSGITPPAAAALAIPRDERTDEQKRSLRNFYRDRVSRDFKTLNEASMAAKKASDDYDTNVTKVMVMDDASPRETHVLTKGAYDKPQGDALTAGVPAILNALPAGEKNNRLGLAKWLFASDNPLTARVTVNRYWQQFFGVGIVKTVDDFGAQGERPINPELLDYLAVMFRESNWNVKQLVRLYVTSATYRQSSKVTAELLEKDPENRLLARGPRYRLPSITLRDQALAASGLLVDKIGGPPVKPYQPPGIWEEATFGFIKYEQDHGDALYRRSLYTFWRRIVGPTEFFDTPSRTSCTVRPQRTNTPLHALTTLNDVTFVEAARALAQRVMLAEKTKEARLDLAYRLVLSRHPSDKEREVLLSGVDRLTLDYEADKAAAKKLLSEGESKRDESLNLGDHAAWTSLCLEILNLDEAMTKE